jgi:hypothetical protein
MVDREDLSKQLMGTAARQGRDQRADSDALRRKRYGSQGNPRIRDLDRSEEQVIPYEEAVPAGIFSIGGKSSQSPNVEEIRERGDGDTVTQAMTSD